MWSVLYIRSPSYDKVTYHEGLEAPLDSANAFPSPRNVTTIQVEHA